MLSDAGRTVSYWMLTSEAPQGVPLMEDVTTDVVVVGAGISGLTTAYLLAREGREVIVLEDGVIGGGETSRTTAHLSSALDDRYSHLEKLHGETGARLAAQSHTAAIDRIEQLVRDESIDCDFARVDGYLFVPPTESTDVLDSELEAAQRAGLAVERVGGLPPSSYDFGPALRFPRQAQFHIMRYLHGLAAAITRLGGRICTGVHVDRVTSGSEPQVHTDHGRTVRANAVIVATDSPVNEIVTVHTKQAAYRTYVIAAQIPDGSLPDFLAWDTADPYHYVRTARAPGRDRSAASALIVGGEDHKTGQPPPDPQAPYHALEQWMRDRFPMAGAIVARWSGQVIEPNDGLAFIGPAPHAANVYVVTGDSGNGLTHGTIAGLLLTDLLQGRDNPWAQLYDPGRISLRAAGEFARENLNVARQYAELLTGGDNEAMEIARGEGRVVRRGVHKVAAYRDEQGDLHELSALCTHLGCVVAWNAGEKTWDCPCHGSRFDKLDGHVVNGPALKALSPAPAEGAPEPPPLTDLVVPPAAYR